MSRPIVVIPSCTKLIEGNIFDSVGRQYSTAIAEVAECQPLLIPLGASMTDVGAVLEIVIDGLTAETVRAAMRAALHAAIEVGPANGLLGITAGNYGGTLGPHQFHLRHLLS